MRQLSVKQLTRAAVVAALYAAITLTLAPIGFGPWQLRVAEAMTLLPALWPEAGVGLFVGCALSNLVGGYGLPDIIVGSLATLAAALLTRRLRAKPALAALPPVLINAVAIGLLLHYVLKAPLWLTMLQVGAGQAAACYALGLPLLAAMRRISK